ncbi:MAG: diadenylate cyclase CdaA [Oscillospiraceae bacterium]|nr:diadenylate cyclase CdaA [Oscillospiraceae bacterium]
MLDYITDILQNFVRIIMSISFFDILDILILTFLVYYIIKLMRETRAMQLLKGIFILIIIYVVVQLCQLKAMSFLMENFLQVGILAIIIVFQPELRRILEKVGRTKVSTIALTIDYDAANNPRDIAIKGIAEACEMLHNTKTGALIIIERQIKLGDIIEKAQVVNADPNPELFCNLFFNKAPLHDGAVIIRNNRIYAAGCFLPNTTKDQYLPAALGSRHRAAVGMSENSDALVIVVSEETGTISIAMDGQLTRDLNRESLTNILRSKMPGNPAQEKKRLRGKKALRGR